MSGSEISIVKARKIWREGIALDQASFPQMVVPESSDLYVLSRFFAPTVGVQPGLAPHLEGDQVSDHPVADIIGQSACIWVGDQLFGHPRHYLGQLLVQN